MESILSHYLDWSCCSHTVYLYIPRLDSYESSVVAEQYVMTIGQLLDFIAENHAGKVFREFTEEQTAYAVDKGIRDGTLYYTTDGDKITGMILFEKRAGNVLFVLENLAMTLDNLKLFAARGRQMFPGMKLEYLKHDKYKKPDTNKLYERLKI